MLEVRHALELPDPNPETKKGDRVLVSMEGVVVRSYGRTRPDGTKENVRVLDIDRIRTAIIVSSQ